jgi:opacity protein-like surface antigen
MGLTQLRNLEQRLPMEYIKIKIGVIDTKLLLKKALIVIVLLSASVCHAQTWELGFTAGTAGYMGDLNQRNPVKPSGLVLGGFLKRNINGYLSAKLQYTIGEIQGADSTSRYEQFRNRNLSFRTRLNEVSLIGEFNFMEYQPGNDKNFFTPFIYAGIGTVNYTPRAMYQGTLYDLRPLATEGQSKPYSSNAITLPYGVGVKYNISGKLNIIADIGYRNPNTDYLDDVSGYYAPKASFTDPVAAALSDRSSERVPNFTNAAGSQRGDLRKRDTYWFFGLTISYTFVTQNCYF